MPRFPLTRTLGPLGVQVAAPKWYLAGGISASACVAAYQPKGSTSLAASYTNLANPGTYDAAPGVAPTFATTTGWTFNGTTQYLTTNIPRQTYDSTLIVAFNSITNNGYVAGVANTPASGNSFALAPRRSLAGVWYIYGSASIIEVAPSLTAGVLCQAGNIGYRNGVAEATFALAVGVYDAPYLGGQRTSGTSLFAPIAGNITAAAIYNTTLSAAQVAAVSSAMGAL